MSTGSGYNTVLLSSSTPFETQFLSFIAAFYQFHQNYIHGEFSSCKVYKERVKNCIKWKTSRSLEAKVGQTVHVMIINQYVIVVHKLCVCHVFCT